MFAPDRALMKNLIFEVEDPTRKKSASLRHPLIHTLERCSITIIALVAELEKFHCKKITQRSI